MVIDLAAIRLRNQQKAAAKQQAVSGSTNNNGSTIVTNGSPIDTANAVAAAQNASKISTTQQWVSTPTGHKLQDVPVTPPAPKPSYSGLDIYGDTSGSKSTNAAPMVTAGTTPTKQIDLNSYKYGQQAAEANVKDPTYLTKRNDDLASYYAGKNIVDSASILQDLKKNSGFSIATIEEQNNTARAIADRIAAQKAEQQKGEQGQWSVTSNNSLTGIDQLNTDLDKLVKEGNKASNQTVDAFINTRIQVDKNKANYTNFDAVEAKAQSINTALRGVYMDKYKQGDANFMNPPTPQEIQAIAQKTGTTVEDVNQFLQGKLFENQLVETDAYKKQVGKSFDRGIEDLTTQKDRQLQDLDLKLQYAEEDTNYQIQEVEKMLERNINVTSISGGLSGALQSSNYVQGITNIKNDAQSAIARIKELWKRQQTATGLEKEAILKDYTTAVSRAKTDLEDSFKEIRSNAELQLSNAKTKYNLDPENLLDALTKIGENVDMNKINVFNNYVGAMNNVFSTVQSSINMVNGAEDRIMAKQEKVMEYYTTNNGLALMNAKPSDITAQVQKGVLSVDQAKTLMQYKIGLTVNTLRNAGINANMQQITEMLSVQDMTPQEVLSSFGITTPTVNDKTTTTSNTYNNMLNINGGAPMGDLRGLASQFPGQAWAKNNNPAGITWNANFDNPDANPNSTAARLKAAGINFSKGTPRPANEGGNYVTFATIEDGLAAQRIMMQGTYGNSTVGQMLAKWVGTKEGPNYAKQVAGMAGITDLNVKVSDLTEEQMGALQMAKIKKESPGLAKILAQNASNGASQGDISSEMILKFNDDVSRRKMPDAEVKKIADAKAAVMKDPNSAISDVLAWSAGGKNIGETQSKTIIKFEQAMSQIDSIQNQIKDMETGPIIGRLRKMNPYDTKAQVLGAQLTALIPTVARGVYGEVGVLTDNDVRLYAQTIPNLTSTDDVNKGVLAFTLDVIAGGYKKQLTSLAGQGYDVSGLEGTYTNIKSKADALRTQIGMNSNGGSQAAVNGGIKSKGKVR